MNSMKSNCYAVCIQMCELSDEMDKSNNMVILAGDLVQIRSMSSNSDRCLVQFFDRKRKSFRPTLYNCEKENLYEISNIMWPFIQDITVESIVKLKMILSGDQIIINFRVKFFGKIPSLGCGDRFYGLQLMPSPHITKEHIKELNEIYMSPTLNLIILRADRLILNLVINATSDNPKLDAQHTNRVERTIYINDPNKVNYEFKLVPNIKPNVVDDTQKSDSSKSQKHTRNIIPDYNRKNVTISMPDSSDDTSLNESRTSSQENLRIENKGGDCMSLCFGCGKKNDALIRFDCQHIFCSKCLFKSLDEDNLENNYCPYKHRNFNCRYKLTIDDLQYIFNILNDNLDRQRDDSSKTKRIHRCDNCQFISKIDGRDHYQCIKCGIWNRIERGIDYKGLPPRHQNVPPHKLGTDQTWTCTYCAYGENHLDTIKCAICHKTNDKLVRKRNKAEYHRLLELEQNDKFIPNVDQFYCDFCDQMILPEIGVRLRSCLHNICRKCIVSYIERQDQVKIKCPHSKCTQFLDDREIKTLLSPNAYAKHRAKSINTSALRTAIETWKCTNCGYGENLIDKIKCIVCDRANEKSERKSNTMEYYRLVELEQNDTFIPNFEPFYCVFCDQTIAAENGVRLRSCLHNICRKCIVSYIERHDQIEIKCPHSICTHLLQDREIRTLILPAAYDIRLKKSINIGKMSIKNGHQCCRPGCEGFWEYDNANAKYNCPNCNTENCIPCKASHPGITCNDFQTQSKAAV